MVSPEAPPGLTLNMDWKEPMSSSDADRSAQQRALDWQLGWFADPVYKGWKDSHIPEAGLNHADTSDKILYNLNIYILNI